MSSLRDEDQLAVINHRPLPLKALVTGGGGFLGRYITEQLIARGDDVRSFARGDYPELRTAGAETVQGDIRDAAAVVSACSGMDVVFHTAALAGIWGPWQTYYEINVQGTVNVLCGCKKSGVGKLVFSSSPSVTFDGTNQRNVDESAAIPDRWLCHYPHTKALAEARVLAANCEALMTCALRPHLIWGPRDQHLIPRLLDRARRGRLRQVGDGTNLVDMVYVENAAKAHLQAADALEAAAPVAGSAYFITQGEPVNLWDWINEILVRADVAPVRKKISLKAAWRLGGLCESLFGILRLNTEPPMTRFLAAQLATDHYFDISRARRDFGYVPIVSTAEGMRRLAPGFSDG